MRCRRCAERAVAGAERNETWEDGEGTKWVGGEDTTVVAIPGVLKYLDAELAAMGVRLKFSIGP